MRLAFFAGADPLIRTLNPDGQDDTACVVVAGPEHNLFLHVEDAESARRLAKALEAAAVALDRARGVTWSPVPARAEHAEYCGSHIYCDGRRMQCTCGARGAA